jgi:hypothetical protein
METTMTNSFLAILPLAHPHVVTSDALVAELRYLRPNYSAKIEATEGANNLIVTLGTGQFTVMVIDAPVPPATFDRAISGGQLWPEADAQAVLATHQAHIVAANMDDGTTPEHRLAAATDLTWLCAALTSLTPCQGVYWSASQTICKRKNFLDTYAAMTDRNVPLTIWTRQHLFTGPDLAGRHTYGCVTTGVASFVGRELEFDAAPMPPEELIGHTFALTQWLVFKGPVLKHDEQMKVSPTEHFRIKIADQGTLLKQPVYRLICGA